MVQSFVKNAADPQQVREGRRKEKEKRREELADIRDLMALKAGRQFIWRLINEICHYDATSAQHSGSMTYLLEGERNVGRIVKGDVFEAAIDEYQAMEREYLKDRIGLEDENNGAAKTG